MLGRFLLRMVGKLAARPVRRRIAQFHEATKDPLRHQSELLRTILAYHADTAFGRDHGFRTISTPADFRRQVPIGPYEYVAPYIDRVMKGEINALLADPKVLMFALTSGTTAARKHIPITAQYLDDYRRGWNIWGLTAIDEHRPISLKPVIQLVGDPEEYRSDAGIPCGSLSGFTAQVQKRIVRFLYCVPAITGKIKDSPTRYYVALRFSLPRKVGLISAANPSTLSALARVMDQEKESLIRDIADGTLSAKLDIPAEMRAYYQRKLKRDPKRAAELESFVRRDGALLPQAAWPPESLLIGCWTGGSVGPYLRQLERYYGATPIRDIGLLASEGRMTIPLQDRTPSGVLDITSHYFEFVPESEIDPLDPTKNQSPTVLGAHELKEGGSYYILPTTKSGLYRYQIVDVVRVKGFHHKTPMVEFLSKGSRFSSLTGEKLSEHHVTQTMDAVVRKIPQSVSAYTLAPCWEGTQPHYALFLEECDIRDSQLLQQFLREFDHELGVRNVEYAAKRESGRIDPIRVVVIPTGTWQQWDRERLFKNGGSPEQYKHPCLLSDTQFKSTMPIVREIGPS